MCRVKLIDKNQELINLMNLEEILDGLARAGGAQWNGHILRRNTLLQFN